MIGIIKKEKRFILFSVAVGVIVSVISGLVFVRNYSERVQETIAQNVIRFHVVANSDSENDQELKLMVRDGIIEYLEDELEECKSREESIQIIGENLEDIEKIAEEIAFENGFHYDVKATLTEEVFPVRQYGDVKLPMGEYEALKISIGKGEGHNWWCVVYPPLCFIDIATGITDESQKALIEVCGNDVFIENGDFKAEFRFKVVELWQEWKNRDKITAVKP